MKLSNFKLKIPVLLALKSNK